MRKGAFFLFLAWAVLLISGYYVYHKPGADFMLGIPSIEWNGWRAFGLHWLLLLRDIAAASGIFLVCLGSGRLLLGRYRLEGLDGLALQIGAGLGVWSIVWLGLALAGLAYLWVAWILLGLTLALLWKTIRVGLEQIEDLKVFWTFAGHLERFFIIAAAILLANQLWIVFSPAIKYDALTYHLALPRLILASGRLQYIPANPYWGHPQVAEMIFTWAMALSGTNAAALIGWLVGVVALVGCAGLAVRWLPGETDPHKLSAALSMTLAALAAGCTARWMTAWAYTDLFSALMGIGGLTCLLGWRESGRGGWLVWLGIFCGLAVGTKYTAGLLPVLLYPAAFLSPGVNHRSFKPLIVSGLIALAVFSPWAVKNLAFTGSPLFPYLLPTSDFSAARIAAANLPVSDKNWLNSLFLPITLTWNGVDSAAGSGTDLGPLLLLFALPGLWIYRRSSRTRILLGGLLLCWLVIGLGGARFDHLRQPRLLFVMLPALAAAAGWGWTAIQALEVNGLQIRLRRISGALVVLALLLSIGLELPRPLLSGALLTALGLHSSDSYLYDNTGAYYEAMRVIPELPAETRVLMLWEGRSLYAPLNTIPDPWLDRWRTDLHANGNAESVLRAWRSQGYTKILLYIPGVEMMGRADPNLTAADWREFDRLFASLPEPRVLTNDFYRIYSLP